MQKTKQPALKSVSFENDALPLRVILHCRRTMTAGDEVTLNANETIIAKTMHGHCRNIIITFANQKGGVGKSTLCALFAHYLTMMGVKVLVVDADRQQTLSQLRSLNLLGAASKEAGDNTAHKRQDKRYVNILTGKLWDIEPLAIRDSEEVAAHIQRLKGFDGVVLVDSPGSLTENGMVPLVLLSDLIFCPYFYEMQTLMSTANFIVFIQKLRKRFPDMAAELILLPNRYKPNVGTSKERERIDETVLVLRKYGKVAPDIKTSSRIQHYNTTEFNLWQKEACHTAFDFILEETGLAALFDEWHNLADD